MVFKLIRFFSILLSNVNLQEQYTELPTRDETVKTTQNSKNMTIYNLIFCFCVQLSILMVYKMFKRRNKPVLAYKRNLNARERTKQIPYSRL